VITEFKASVGPNGAVTFSGKVIDDKPVAGLSVGIVVGLLGQPAIVDENGNFRTTMTGFTPGAYTATATVTDAQGAKSAPRQTTFVVP
jgi:hypothetical protein